MPEMMGVVLMIDMLQKDGRRREEFEELRRHQPGRLATAVKRFRQRWSR